MMYGEIEKKTRKMQTAIENAGTRLPRLLNQDFTIHSYDGGVFGEGAISSNFDIRNVLIPTREAFHCSDAGTKKNLVLKCSSEFTISHLFIQAPPRKCTEPVNRCLVWVSEDEPDVASTRYLDDLPIDLIQNKFTGEFGPTDPVAVTTSRDTLEGEFEFHPPRSGRYIHIKFFDTHSDLQENIDIAVVGIVGWVVPLPILAPDRPLFGPWSKREVIRMHAHPLTLTFSNRGWCCDGRDFSGGCRSGFSDFNETSVFDVSFRCTTCGFDLCELCVMDNTLGKVTAVSAKFDLKAIRTLIVGRPFAHRRLVVQRVLQQLQSDPGALVLYLKAGLIDVMKSKLKNFQKDILHILALLISRLGHVKEKVPPIFRSNLFLYMDPQKSPDDWEFVVPGTLPPDLLLLAANTEAVVRATAMRHKEETSDPALVDWAIPTASGKTLLASVPASPNTSSIEMDIEESDNVDNSIKSCSEWFHQLQGKLLYPLLDILTNSTLQSDFVHAFILLNRGSLADERVSLLTLKLLCGTDPSLGLRLLVSFDRNTLPVRFAREWANRFSDLGDDVQHIKDIAPENSLLDCDADALIEKILVSESLQVPGTAGLLSQLAQPHSVQVGAHAAVRVTPLSTLGALARYVLATQSVCDKSYLLFCHELVGSSIRLDNRVWRVVGFEILTELRLGFHRLQDGSEEELVNLSIPVWLIVDRAIPSEWSKLRACVSYVQLLQSSDEFWKQLNTPGFVIHGNELTDLVASLILPKSRKCNWIVPVSGLDIDVLSILAPLAQSAPQPSETISSFSVGLLVDVNEVPFELLWPMIRDEVMEAVRPLRAFQISEAAVAAGVRSNGIGVVARNLSREEADRVSQQLAGVIQSTVFEEHHPAHPSVERLGARTDSGVVVSVNGASVDLVDEQTGELRRNVATVPTTGTSVRETLLRRFFQDDNLMAMGHMGEFFAPEEEEEEDEGMEEAMEEATMTLRPPMGMQFTARPVGMHERIGIMSRLIAASDLFRVDPAPVAESTQVVPGSVPGIAKGLNAPIVARYSANELSSNNSAVDTPMEENSSGVTVSLRAPGSDEWTVVTAATSKLPLMALGDRFEWRFDFTHSDTFHPLKKQRTYEGVIPSDDSKLGDWVSLLRRLDISNLLSNERLDILKSVLAKRLLAILDDQPALVVGSALLRGTASLLPSWLSLLPKEFPELFSYALRLKLFRFTSFPAAMTVHWIQQGRVGELIRRRAQIQSDLNEAEGRRMQQLSQELSNIEERIGRNPWWLGSVECVLARLRKTTDFLPMSAALMQSLQNSSAMLEIQFEGETGFGSAVTRSFFVELAKEFLKKMTLQLWLANNDNAIYVHVPTRGLRLQPYTDCPSSVTDLCLLMGQLIGRAVLEGYIFPLQLSLETWAIIRNPQAHRPDSGLPCPGDNTCGEFIGACLAETPEGVGALLQSVGAVFLESGFGGQELVPNGANIAVTEANVSEFLECARRFYLHEGIEAQVAAIRLGISQAVALDSLLFFSPEELRTLVCGEDEIAWDEAGLRDILNFHLEGDMNEWLIQILLEMDNTKRSTFLDFVTSCPRLPPQLKIEIFSETIVSSNLTSPVLRPASPPGDSSPMSGAASPTASEDDEVVGYPRSRACVNHLYLPRYKARETLKERLIEAMVSSVHHDEIS